MNAAVAPRVGISTLGTDGGRSGIGQYLTQLLRAWSSFGNAEHLELFVTPGDRGVFPAVNSSRISVPQWAANPYLSFAWHQWSLPKACDRGALDVLFLPAANRRSAAPGSVPAIGTVHDFSSLHVSGKYGPVRDLYIKKILPRLVRRLDRIIAPSRASKSDIVEFAQVPEERVLVIPNGVDHGRFRPLADDEAEVRARTELGLEGPYILYVSRIEHPGKNHVRLIESFGRMKRREGLPHRLVFAGSDWNRAEQVHTAAQASPVCSSIDFLGFVPDRLLPALTASADIAVFPSLYEGFGIPVLEAMACGTPVVASSTSSIPEVGGESAGYFDPTDVEAMDSAMTRVLTDRELHHRMSRSGLARATSFSWKATADATMEAIVSCAREGRS